MRILAIRRLTSALAKSGQADLMTAIFGTAFSGSEMNEARAIVGLELFKAGRKDEAKISATQVNKSSPAGQAILWATEMEKAPAAGAGTSFMSIRLNTRSALLGAPSKVGCNSSNQMNESLTWQINGSVAPALWIQDATTPAFPGRLLMNLNGSSGTVQTGYVVNNRKSTLLWLIDQSAGIPAIFDNALAYKSLGILYNCP